MEISAVYRRRRSQFGRPCVFHERKAELLLDIMPDAALRSQFIARNPCEAAALAASQYSEHEVNTERFSTEHKGVNHVEGGWPRDIDPSELEHTMRYRKKVEKDEGYMQAVLDLGKSVEHVIKQNRAIDIYEDYFPEEFDEAQIEPHSARTIRLFKDPSTLKRSALCMSWYPDGPSKLAVAYGVLDSQQTPVNMSYDSYIWDIENPNVPEMTITPSSPLICVEYNPKDVHVLLAGCKNGQVAAWDTRKGSRPVETTPIKKSHRDPVYRARFIQSKTGTEAFSCSTDGHVLWWDIRKLNEPTDSLILDLGQRGIVTGAIALEYETTMPSKFMVGTERGSVLSCNRKGKNTQERIVHQFNAHHGPVFSVERNPFFPKYFLTVGDWSARIWSEDIRESPILWTQYDANYLTDGCWSPSRPSVFFTSAMDGSMHIWDFLLKPGQPSFSMKVCEGGLQSLRVQEQGCYITCGGKNGDVALVELGSSVSKLQPSEKAATSLMFERESSREKTILSRMRELAVKERPKQNISSLSTSNPSSASVTSMEAQHDEWIAEAEKAFWNAVQADEESKKNKKAQRDFGRVDTSPADAGADARSSRSNQTLQQTELLPQSVTPEPDIFAETQRLDDSVLPQDEETATENGHLEQTNGHREETPDGLIAESTQQQRAQTADADEEQAAEDEFEAEEEEEEAAEAEDDENNRQEPLPPSSSTDSHQQPVEQDSEPQASEPQAAEPDGHDVEAEDDERRREEEQVRELQALQREPALRHQQLNQALLEDSEAPPVE
eukprot:m.420643 g.420643  ORF g.420643 m.420643 type:complete len:780 (-) comp56637_c0_seq4:151-2490(-)